MALWNENDAKAEKPVKAPAKADPAPAPAPEPVNPDPAYAGQDGVVTEAERVNVVNEYSKFPQRYQSAAAGEVVEFVSELDYVWDGGTEAQPAPPVEDQPASE